MNETTQTTNQVAMRLGTILPGTEVCKVARDGARCAGRYPIWTLGLYIAQPRKDGVLTWRRAGKIYDTRSGFRPSNKFVTECRAFAEKQGIPYLPEADHNRPVRSN